MAGDAGIGKTRLIAEFKASLAGLRVRIGTSQCREFAQRPFAPVLDVLARLGPQVEDLAPGASRADQFDLIARAFARSAEHRAVVALIEDIHWADPGTLELLISIARDAGRQRILVVATYRWDAIYDEHPLFGSLSKLHRLTNTTMLELQPLQRPELTVLIDTALEGVAQLPHETRATVLRLSEGNPFFAEELLKSAVDRSRAGSGTHPLPTTIRAAVVERLRPLETRERDVLVHASVIGRRFSVELLRATLDQSAEQILLALRRARELQLIIEETPETFSFRHALTREAIYGTFLAVQLRAIHRRIALALEALPEHQRSLQDLAYHWWAARDPEKASHYGELAADAAMQVFAYEEASRYYEYSLAFAERDCAKSGALFRKLGWAFSRSGANSLASRAYEQACAAFRNVGDLRAECNACNEFAGELYSVGDENCTRPLLEMRERLQSFENRGLRAQVEVFLAQLYTLLSQGDEAARLLRTIEYDLLADDRLLTVYHGACASLAGKIADLDGYADAVRKALFACDAGELYNYRAIVLSNAASAFSDLGRSDQAEWFFLETESFARKHNLTATLMFVLAIKAKHSVLRGELTNARALIGEALSCSIEYEIARPILAAWGVVVGTLLEDKERVARCFDDELTSSRWLDVASAYAEHWHRLGRFADAKELLHRSMNRPADARDPFMLYLAIARIGDAGDIVPAREHMARYAAYTPDIVYKAALPLFDALVARRRGDPARAAAHAAAAIDRFHEVGYPLWEAEACELAGRGEDAATIYRRIGAVARLRNVHVRAAVPSDTASTRVPRVPGDLSAREREVAESVARGSTNAEIAVELSVTVKAVEKHLSSIYKKLGVTSRGKLAAFLREAHGAMA